MAFQHASSYPLGIDPFLSGCSPMSFLAEMKRRKVLRVAGAYVVGAWIVLQGAAQVLPALEMPSWTMKLVALIAILGFPLALILGWVFDLTPGGVERTDDTARFRFPAGAMIAGTLIVIVGVSGFLVVRRQLNAKGIDPNSVVVLPFRVSGDENLAVMREGMVDLIAPKLTGIGGPRAVDSRTTLSAWRRTINSEDEDLAPREAIKLARKLGAAQVILGEVVGTPGEISLNARVYSTIDGAPSDPARVRTTQDSLLTAVDLLITELLTRHAGEGDRLAELLTESLPAVQAYLDGKRTFRLGSYEEAAKHFARAVDLDSTFALAAWGELTARGWAGFGPRYIRAVNLAFASRDRLPPRERDMLFAWFGEHYPKGQSYAASMQNMEAVSARYPDSPEVWYELGDAYFHRGQPLGLQDFEDRALTAWARAIELDSSFAGPWEHQLEIHVARGDTARVREVYEKLKQLKSDKIETTAGWVYAAATANDTMRARLLMGVPEWSRATIFTTISTVMQSGAPPVGIDSVVDFYINTAKTDAQRVSANNNAAVYALSRGRPNEAFAHLRAAKAANSNEFDYTFNMLNFAIGYPTEVPADSVDRHMPAFRAGKAPWIACNAGVWDALNGREPEMRRALQLMADSMPGLDSGYQDFLKACGLLAKVLHASAGDPARARIELARLDSLALNAPMMGPAEANFLATVTARAYAQLGDYERARKAAQRGGYTMRFKSPQILELARAAARTGHRDQAIRNYRIWLSFRDPEPGPGQELTDAVRAELAELTAR